MVTDGRVDVFSAVCSASPARQPASAAAPRSAATTSTPSTSRTTTTVRATDPPVRADAIDDQPPANGGSASTTDPAGVSTSV